MSTGMTSVLCTAACAAYGHPAMIFLLASSFSTGTILMHGYLCREAFD